MAITLPSTSLQLKARYWGAGQIIRAGDVDTDSGALGLVRECHLAYSEAVSGCIVGGGLDDSAAWDSSSVTTTPWTSFTPVAMTIGANVRRVSVYVDGKDVQLRMDTSLGNSTDLNEISGAGQNVETYTRGSPYSETVITVNLSFRKRTGAGSDGEIYRWVIYEEPLVVGELP